MRKSMMRIVMAVGLAMTMTSSVWASGSTGDRGVVVDSHLQTKYHMVKTLDLSESPIDISLSKAEKDQIRQQAEALAEKYVTNRVASMGEWMGQEEARQYSLEQQDREIMTQIAESYYTYKAQGAKVARQLNVQCGFSIGEIPEDEYEKYGIGSDVKAGPLDADIRMTVDFCSEEQMLDQDLNSMMALAESQPSKDLMELLSTHLLYYVGGELRADNDSEMKEATLPDDSEYPGWRVTSPEGNAEWLGDHALLTSYTNTFGLHESNSVTYVYSCYQDLITNVTGKDSRITSVSKPLPIFPTWSDDENPALLALAGNLKGADTDSIYRYKVTETGVEPAELTVGGKSVTLADAGDNLAYVDVTVDGQGNVSLAGEFEYVNKAKPVEETTEQPPTEETTTGEQPPTEEDTVTSEIPPAKEESKTQESPGEKTVTSSKTPVEAQSRTVGTPSTNSTHIGYYNAPETGDSTEIMIYVGIALLAGLAAAATALFRRRKNI